MNESENKPISLNNEKKPEDKRSRIIKYAGASNFTHINNTPINDENISDSALGILLYVLSKPNDWVIYVNQLCKRFKRSKTKIYSVIEELINLGYMRRRQERHPTQGYVTGWITEAADYPLFLEPREVLLHPNLQEVVKTRSCEMDATNKDLNKKRHLQKKNNNKPIATKSTNTKTNIATIHSEDVVVSWVKKLNENGFGGISHETVKGWLGTHGESRVAANLAYSLGEIKKGTSIQNKPGYLAKAIKNDYATSKTVPVIEATTMLRSKAKRRTHEEDVTAWKQFTTTKRQEWIDIASGMCSSLPFHLERLGSKEILLSDDFVDKDEFKLVMHVLKRE